MLHLSELMQFMIVCFCRRITPYMPLVPPLRGLEGALTPLTHLLLKHYMSTVLVPVRVIEYSFLEEAISPNAHVVKLLTIAQF